MGAERNHGGQLARGPSAARPAAKRAAGARPAKLTRSGAGGLILLMGITLTALYSQLSVAGVVGGGSRSSHGEASRRRTLLTGLGCTSKNEMAKLEYRRLHSHEVTVSPEQLECSGELTPGTQALLAAQLQEERERAALLPFQPPPRFMANAASRHKRCRAAPRGQDRPPVLHRVALLMPGGPGASAEAQDAVQAAAQWRRQLLVLEQEGGQALVQQEFGRRRELPWEEGGLQAEQQQQQLQQQRQQQQQQQQQRPADISVVTQLSLDRLASLEAQCATWRGPIVAVLYAPLVGGRVAGLDNHPQAELAALAGSSPLDALAFVRAAYRRITSVPGRCQLTLEFVVEERCSPALAGLWPINANRNRALMLATTPVVALLDVDFLLAGSLSPWLTPPPQGQEQEAGQGAALRRRQLSAGGSTAGSASTGGSRGGGPGGDGESGASGGSKAAAGAGAPPVSSPGGSHNQSRSQDDAWLAEMLAAGQRHGQGWLQAVLSQNAAVVLPAFQTNGTQQPAQLGTALAWRTAGASKADVAALAAQQRIFGFQQHSYPRGHKATRYWWWLQTDQPYAVDYWQGYEPFLLIPTTRCPFYDERFRGYGWDKHVHTLHAVRQLGMKLVVHPEAWLVHMPHRHSAAQRLSRQTGQRTKLHDLFIDTRRRILSGKYVPVTAFYKMCLTAAQAAAAAEAAGSVERAAELARAVQQAQLMRAQRQEQQQEQRVAAGAAAELAATGSISSTGQQQRQQQQQ